MAGALPASQVMKPPLGRRPVPANCLVDELNVDPLYQRGTDNQHARRLIRHIAINWDWSLCQPLIVARRSDETLWVVDGQHRLQAAIERGDIRDLPCVIIHYGDVALEAKGFVALNTARRALTPYALYNAAAASGDPKARALAVMLGDAELSVTGAADSKVLKPGQLNNIGTLRLYQTRHGDERLRRVLQIMSRAFSGEPLRHGTILFTAIGALIASSAPVDDGLLEGVLCGSTQDEWAQAIIDNQAISGRARAVAAQHVLRAAYAEANEE